MPGTDAGISSEPMIALLDCDGSETLALRRELDRLDSGVRSVQSADELCRASKLIIPHTKSYRRTLANIRDRGLIAPLLAAIDAGCPVLAVSSGLHLLFDVMYDEAQHVGLGVVHGKVAQFDFGVHPAARHFGIPHQGWNQIVWNNDCPLLSGLKNGEYFYFDHACHAEPLDGRYIAARCNHGIDFAAVVRRGDIFGTQFLPERSDAAGQTVLANFLNLNL